MSKLKSFRDLRVYQQLRALHLEVDALTRDFPRDERFELGSQVRRSSNGAAAILAEGWGSRHTNIYMEAVNRAMGEVRETQHHLDIAHEKGYLSDEDFRRLDGQYDACGRMLTQLSMALSRWRNTTRSGRDVREDTEPYAVPDWEDIASLTHRTFAEGTSACQP